MRRWISLFVLVFTACGGTQVEVNEASNLPLTSSRLYPMLEDSQWVYDVTTGPEPPTLGIFEVIEVNGAERAIANNRGMDSNGQVRHAEPVRYVLETDGIRRSAGGWLLRDPIEVGHSWDSGGGREARITTLDRAIETIAGNFDNCVEVEESGGSDGRVLNTVYCPGIGPVLIESTMSTRITMRTVSVSARLRTYHIPQP